MAIRSKRLAAFIALWPLFVFGLPCLGGTVVFLAFYGLTYQEHPEDHVLIDKFESNRPRFELIIKMMKEDGIDSVRLSPLRVEPHDSKPISRRRLVAYSREMSILELDAAGVQTRDEMTMFIFSKSFTTVKGIGYSHAENGDRLGNRRIVIDNKEHTDVLHIEGRWYVIIHYNDL